MICNKCKNEIDDNSVFCEFCGERVVLQINKDISGYVQSKCKIGKRGITSYSKHVEVLEKKIWFRIVKIVYILIFLSVAIFGGGIIFVEWQPEKIVDKSESVIVCDNGERHGIEEVEEKKYKELCSDLTLEDIERIVIKEDGTAWQEFIKTTRYEYNKKWGLSLYEKDIPQLALNEVKKEFGTEIYEKEKNRRIEEKYQEKLREMEKNYHVKTEYKNNRSWWIAIMLTLGYLISVVGIFFIIRSVFYYIIFGKLNNL